MPAKRTTPSAEPIFKSLDQCDDALREIAEIERANNAVNDDLNRQIEILRADADRAMQSAVERKLRLEKDLEEFTTFHREDLFDSGRKTLELTHGFVGFRQHPPSVTVLKSGKWTVAKVIAAIRDFFTDESAERFIRTKEELNKDELVTADPNALRKCGLEIVHKETFGYKLKLEDVGEQIANRPAEIRDMKSTRNPAKAAA